MWYGSEYRPIHQLEGIFKLHKDWEYLKNQLQKGAAYPLRKIGKAARLQNLHQMMSRGNHKSAESKIEIVRNLTQDDVTKGFALPLPRLVAPLIKNGEVYPVGLASNQTFNETGKEILRYRLTHDLSFPVKKGIAINDRVEKDKLLVLQYGFAFLRTLHHLHTLRQNHPQGILLINKRDLKDAYRRVHTWAHIAAACMILVQDFVLMLLRLPFGSSPAPGEFCLSSEMVVDLANDLLSDRSWDNTDFPIPYIAQIPQPSQSKPLAHPVQALPLEVPTPYRPSGCCDGYVDDMWIVVLGEEKWIARANIALDAAIQATFRPLAEDEPIPRMDPTSLGKLQAEGRLEECKTILGWTVDTRKHTVSLPKKKAHDWSLSICSFLRQGCATPKAFTSLAGKLNRVAAILPPARHFAGRIYRFANGDPKESMQTLSQEILNDLELWLKLLQAAQEGVSINTLVFREPQVEIITDACEHGIGGFTSTGIFWRLELPDNLLGVFTLNLLEFIASVLTVIMTIRPGAKYLCVRARSDSTSCISWLYKTSFWTEEQHDGIADFRQHLTVARSLASHLIAHEAILHGQHLAGNENGVADSLSRDTDLDPVEHAHLLSLAYPSQITSSSIISTLPEDLCSLLTSWAHGQTKTQAWNKPRTRSNLRRGPVGENTAPALTSVTLSSLTCPKSGECALPVPSCTPSERVDLQKIRQEMIPSPQDIQGQPSTMWLRPCGRVATGTRG